MTKKEEVINEINGLSEPSLDRILDLIRCIKMDFSFKDLMMHINDRGMQNLLKRIEPSTIALALKKAPDELIEKFFKNMPKRESDNIREEMDFMGPIRITDVEKAQRSIIDMVRRLEKEYELIIGDEEIIV